MKTAEEVELRALRVEVVRLTRELAEGHERDLGNVREVLHWQARALVAERWSMAFGTIALVVVREDS